MDDELSFWESKLGALTPAQRQHVIEWFDEERESWADRQEEWERVQAAMLIKVRDGDRAGRS